MVMVEPHRNGVLRTAARVALGIGAAGSLALMFRAGQSAPRFLLVLFALWVVSPFVVLAIADALSTRWSTFTRGALHAMTILVTILSLAGYAVVALGPPRQKNAPVFVLTPPLSWLLIGIALPTAAIISRRRSARGESVAPGRALQ